MLSKKVDILSSLFFLCYKMYTSLSKHQLPNMAARKLTDLHTSRLPCSWLETRQLTAIGWLLLNYK